MAILRPRKGVPRFVGMSTLVVSRTYAGRGSVTALGGYEGGRFIELLSVASVYDKGEKIRVRFPVETEDSSTFMSSERFQGLTRPLTQCSFPGE
jgi:hypothetical protein